MVQFPAASSWTRECRLTYLLTVSLTFGVPLTLPHTKKTRNTTTTKKGLCDGVGEDCARYKVF